MNLETFQDLLDTYGGQFDAWPVDVRDDAFELLARSDEAMAMHAEALALDDVLQGDPAPQPSPDAMTDLFGAVARQAEAERTARVQAAMTPAPPAWVRFREQCMRFLFRPAFAVGASAALGIVAGVWDVWLEPAGDTFFLAELIYSAIAL